jgi:hypothetical protein
MQTIKTITRTKTEEVASVHYEEAHKVLSNAHKQVTGLDFDYDGTGSSYFIKATQILANLTKTYYSFCDSDDYISIDELMQCFSCLEYYDEKDLYDNCVQGTALEQVDFYDYLSLSN